MVVVVFYMTSFSSSFSSLATLATPAALSLRQAETTHVT
jgi:hypothetical protein